MHGAGNGWMWPMGGMMAGWLLLTVLMVALVAWLVVGYNARRPAVDETTTARRILAERYARGEIDTEDYQQRMTALQR